MNWTPDTPKDIARWVIQGLVGFFLVQAMTFMRNTEQGLRDLSIKLAVIVEKVTQQDKLIEAHEKRILLLEDIRNGRQGK